MFGTAMPMLYPSRVPTAAFTAVNRFLGWGDPHDGLWFIGMEEALGWADQSADAIIYAHGTKGEVEPCSVEMHERAQSELAGRQIRSNVCRMAAAVCPRYGDSEQWRQYLRNELWLPGTPIFEGNLYPLGKPRRKDWPDSFANLFGFGPQDQAEYERCVEATRFLRFRAPRQRCRPQATVCFGESLWPSFVSALAPTGDVSEEVVGGSSLRRYDGDCILLCPFFGQGQMTLALNARVIEILRQWQVSLP